MISFPKGVNANPAILKCCLAKGMPMIVMANNTPKNIWVMDIQKPPIKIQMRFIMVERQPELLLLSLISVPKGHKATMASFRVCIPKGIPTIVTIKSMLDITYSKEIIMPPKTSQMRFPRNFIAFYFFCKILEAINAKDPNISPVTIPTTGPVINIISLGESGIGILVIMSASCG